MKEKETKIWIPLYVDKWIFGSTRLELEPDERGVFVDLMALAAKDDGYIRANPNMAYLPQQIAGLLNIPVELLERTIEKCVKYKKMVKQKNGILYMTNWDKYQFSERHKRRVMSAETDTMSAKADTIEKNRIEEKNIKEENRIEEKRVCVRFQKPTVQEIKAYCRERNNNVDAQRFFDFYEAKGWKIGKSPMKDWKAAVRTWERNQTEAEKPKPQQSGGAAPVPGKYDGLEEVYENNPPEEAE